MCTIRIMFWRECLFTIITVCSVAIASPISSDLTEEADDLWIDSATALASGQLDDAKIAATESQELAIKARDTFRTFKASALLAQIDEASGDIRSSIQSLLSLRAKARSENDFEVEIRCLHLLAELAERNGVFEESVAFYCSAIELVSDRGTAKQLVAAYLKLVRAYQAMGAHEKAETAIREMLEASQTLPESTQTKLRTSLAVANPSISQAEIVAALKRAKNTYESGLLKFALAKLHLRSGRFQESIDAFELAIKDLPALNLDATRQGSYYYAIALTRAKQQEKARTVLDRLGEALTTPSELRQRVLTLQIHLAESSQQFIQRTQASVAHSRALNLRQSEFRAAITDHRQQIAKREEKQRLELAAENARYKIYVWLGWVSIGLAILVTLMIARYLGKRRVAAINMNRARERVAERRERAVAIGNLASGVAHDFNNLMTVIYSVSETVHKVAAERLTAKETEMLGEVLRATESGIEITRQLLALSRGTADEGNFLVSQHVVGIRGLLARTVGEGIELDIQTSGTNATVIASKAQLTSALINLCANARDAIDHQSGQVTIAVESSCRASGDYVQISVEDNGCGMSPKHLLRATDQHFTTKAVDHGTGLGLSMVARFVSEANGQLGITSQPGRGTRVSMELPCRDTNHAIEYSCIQGMCVLCVDPIASVMNTVRETLQRLGCEVHTALDIDSAHELLDHQISPDVVLLSINALRDQRTGLHRLNQDPKPAVVITAPVTYESDYAPILRVPFTEDELMAAIVKAIEPAEQPASSA